MRRNFNAEAIELEKKMRDQSNGGDVISLDDIKQAHEVAKATGHMQHKLLYVALKRAHEEGQAILEERTRIK
jgi:hypothetical protein